MAWTKEQFIREAYASIAIGKDFDVTPEELQTGLRKLDAMMATWNGRGVRLGYPLPSTPESSTLDTVCNVPDVANEAIYLQLAKRLAGDFGKVMSREAMIAAKEAMDAVLLRSAMPQEQQYPAGLPRGAGNKPWRDTNRPFFPEPDPGLLAGSDGPIDFT